MPRRALAATALLAALLSLARPAAAAWTVILEGRRAEIPALSGEPYLALAPLATHFGLETGTEPRGGYTSLSGPGGRALLRPGMSFVLVGESPVLLSAAVRLDGGGLFLPPDAIEKVLVPLTGKALRIESAAGRITIGSPAVPPRAAPLVRASWETLPDRERIRVDLPAGRGTAGPPRVERRPDGVAAVLPLEPVAFDGNLPASSLLIRALRIVPLDGRTEIRLDLSPACAEVDPRFEGGRLVLDLLRKGEVEAPPQGLLAQVPGTTVEPLAEDEPEGQVPAEGVPEESPRLEDRDAAFDLVVLDPGHGGSDLGAVGPGGLQEKAVTLAIAKALRERLAQEVPGVKVFLTREEDVELPLADRTAFANRSGADLFLSIHANASTSSRVGGAETYILSAEATDAESRALAAIEGNALGPAGESASGAVEMILWDMAQAQYLEQSSLLAETIQKEMNRLAGTSDRGVKQALFAVLVGATMPAALVEVGFLSNPGEEKRLGTGSAQEKIAVALSRSVLAFRARHPSMERASR